MPFIHQGADGETMPPVKADWFDMVVVVTTTLVRVATQVTGGLDTIDDIARAHANWRRERSESFDSMLKEIEAL